MDPAPLTTADWADTGSALKLLWINLVLFATAAVSLGFAHAIIPSALATGTFPGGARKLRPVLYAIGILALAVAIFNFFLVANLLDFLDDTYSRYYQ